MNTAAGMATTSPLQALLQMPADPAAPAAPGADFTAALAAACVAQPEADVPEGMESAAALAWLAGIVNAQSPVAAMAPTHTVDFRDLPAVEAEAGTELVPDPALGILQGMLAPAVHAAPAESAWVAEEAPPVVAIDSAALPVLQVVAGSAAMSVPEVVNPEVTAADERAVPVQTTAVAANPVAGGPAPVDVAGKSAVDLPTRSPTATGAAAGAGAAAVAVVAESVSTAAPQRVAAAVSSNPALRTLVAGQHSDSQADLQEQAGAEPVIATQTGSAGNTPSKPDVAERLLSALAERPSARPDGSSTQPDADRNVIGGANPYASTREAVATVAGQVSTRPEVVHSTVGSPRWANELGSRLLVMSVRGQQEGSLSLTPEHLGPVEVRISVNQDSTTNVWFGAQHADTRAALADALPRLREMFAASGLALGQAGVSHEAPGQQARRGENPGFRPSVEAESVEVRPVARVARVSSGLLDTWA